MLQSKIIKILIVLTPWILLSCLAQRPIQKFSVSESHEHGLSDTISFSDEHYHALMKYDPQKGMLAIEFENRNGKPAQILQPKWTQALLILPGREPRELHFKNIRRKEYPAGSRKAKEQLSRPPKTEIISTKKDNLKNISSFILKVWLVVEGNYYEMEFRYPQVKNLYS
jgi:hypothetical protein